MKKRNKHTSKKIQIEFDEAHLPVLVAALETYSRLQSGQIKMAIDTAYADTNLTYEESQYIENIVRYVVFPPNCVREYDGEHKEFYDRYDNEYDESGNLIKESEEWRKKKNRHHLDHPNTSFGIGCKEMKNGTIAWEIKKAIEEFLHYERNSGYRNMGVDGDGVLNTSGVPNAKILSLNTLSSFKYWKPEKEFRIPQKYQEKIEKAIKNKNFEDAWKIVDKSFKNNALPKGSSTRIEENSGTYYVIVEKPIKNDSINTSI